MATVDFLDAHTNTVFVDYLRKTSPSDYIHLKSEDSKALDEFWRTGNMIENGRIPSDIFFAGNVALCDCEIIEGSMDEQLLGYRVTVFPDYKERIQKARGQAVCVAVVSRKVINEIGYFILILVKEGQDCLSVGPLGCIDEQSFQALREAYGNKTVSHLAKIAGWFMNTWYGIQIALLHPMVRDVFAHPAEERVVAEIPNKGGGKRRVVRYVKKHIVNADEIKKRLVSDSKKFFRHTLCWYVIGHWRKYRNGKKIFIQPYWKGAMRHLKTDQEGREREIAMEGVSS